MSAVTRHAARAAPVASTSGQDLVPSRTIARAVAQQRQQRHTQVVERRQQSSEAKLAAAAHLLFAQRACACAAAVALTSTATWSAPPAAAAAVSPQQQQQQQQQQRERQRQRLSPLAALMADDYLFADADADGRVSPTELASAAAQMGREAGLPALPDTAPDFAARLYDLDGDGELTTDEMLRAMALDAAVDNEAGRLDGGILRAFDADGSGGVSRAEWVGALGPVQGGEAVAGAVFARADLLTGARGQLAPEGLAAALTAARALLLGW